MKMMELIALDCKKILKKWILRQAVWIKKRHTDEQEN